MIIKKDKSDPSCTELVKYFARKYNETNKIVFQVVYARDCSIMQNILHRFFKGKKRPYDIYQFIDAMFEEYPKRRRAIPIDISWLLNMTDVYLYKKPTTKGNKVKSEFKLTDDLKDWLQSEKKKMGLEAQC